MSNSNTLLAILGNLIEQNLVEIPFSEDPSAFLIDFLKKNTDTLLSEKELEAYKKDFNNAEHNSDDFWHYISNDFFDFNRVNNNIKEYLLQFKTQIKQVEALKKLSFNSNNPTYYLIIPNWDGETPEDFSIENWDGIELCKNLEEVIIEGHFVNKKTSYLPFANLIELKSFSLSNGKLNDLEKLLKLPKLKSIILSNTTIPSDKKTKVAIENYLGKGNSLIFDNYTIKDISVFQKLKDLNKYIAAREYDNALPILNLLLETESDSLVKMKLLSQKHNLYTYKRNTDQTPEIFNELIQISKTLNPLFDVNKEILGDYEYRYRKGNNLTDLGYNYYQLNDKEKSAKYYREGLEIAIRPAGGLSNSSISDLTDCLVSLNRKEEIIEVLDKYALLFESQKGGWGDSGIMLRWRSLLEHGYFEKGLTHLEKYMANIYKKGTIQDINQFYSIMKSIQSILVLQHTTLSYNRCYLLSKRDDLYPNFTSFITDIKRCFLKEISITELRDNEKYSEFFSLYTN